MGIEIKVNPIITKGCSYGQLVITQGYSYFEDFPVIVVFKGATDYMIKNPVQNLNFKIDGITHTFTRQMRKDVFGQPNFQGWCYATKYLEYFDKITIEAPLYLIIPRSSGRKPDLKFYFVKWHNPESENREITVTITENMNLLIVEFSAKSRERCC